MVTATPAFRPVGHEIGAVVLSCQDLRKSYGSVQAVDGVSFDIRAGETYGLLGPNGAGKTTVISIVAGVLQAGAGAATLDGLQIGPSTLAAKALIGYVPQDVALYPDLTGRENLAFFASLYRINRRQARARVAEVLDVVGLGERAQELVKKYSGGMKRRLNIAVGLLHRPRLLILDEPTVGVDPQSRNSILDSIEALSAEGMAVLYTTHYMEEAERLCDRVGIIDLGHLIAEGTPGALTASLGEAEHIRMEVEGDLAAAIPVLDALPLVVGTIGDEGHVEVLVPDAESALPGVLQAAHHAGLSIRSVSVQEPDLEAVFLQLTGKRLRD